jgi:putative ABC transport system permease protein
VSIVGVGVTVSVLAGVVGGLAVTWRAANLPAAEAMQPEAPPTYRTSLLERIGIRRILGTSGVMVVREMTRRPVRTLLSCIGIAFGVAVIVVGGFSRGALDVIIYLQFQQAQREDMNVGFTRPLDERAANELAHLPGVLRVEPMHAVPVRLRSGHHFRETALLGLPRDGELRRVVEWPRRIVDVPEEGILLGDSLARVLGIQLGDMVTVEVLEGDRRIRDVRVAALAHEMFGLTAYMSLPALAAMLGSEQVVSAVLMSVDRAFEDDVDARLKRMPRVAGVSRRREVIKQFWEQSAESMTTTSLVLTLFGCAIAIAVVYNNARIALSMRSRDLASLRVLGFTRSEISAVLLGELGAYVALALVPGLLLGKGLAALTISTVDQELYRIPAIVTAEANAFAVAVTLGAAFVSAAVVKRQLDRLDLVAVLKARE